LEMACYFCLVTLCTTSTTLSASTYSLLTFY
jgi:hypothetical protein